MRYSFPWALKMGIIMGSGGMNDTDRGKLKFSELNFSQCQFDHHKSCTEFPVSNLDYLDYGPVTRGVAW
jgi:hypothetical protein